MREWPKFTKTELEDLDKRASQLYQAVFASDNPGTSQLLIKAYLQEAVVYGKLGKWVLDNEDE